MQLLLSGSVKAGTELQHPVLARCLPCDLPHCRLWRVHPTIGVGEKHELPATSGMGRHWHAYLECRTIVDRSSIHGLRSWS